MLWDLDAYPKAFLTGITAFRKLTGKKKRLFWKDTVVPIPWRSHFFHSKTTSHRWLLFGLYWCLWSGAWRESRRIEKAFKDLTTKHGEMCHREGRFQNRLIAHAYLTVLRPLSSPHPCPITKLQTLSMRPPLPGASLLDLHPFSLLLPVLSTSKHVLKVIDTLWANFLEKKSRILIWQPCL